jgi:hypothetical protein
MQIITGQNKKFPLLGGNNRGNKEKLMEVSIKLIHTNFLSNNGGRENEQ